MVGKTLANSFQLVVSIARLQVNCPCSEHLFLVSWVTRKALGNSFHLVVSIVRSQACNIEGRIFCIDFFGRLLLIGVVRTEYTDIRSPPPAKRTRTAADMVHELTGLKSLKDNGVLNGPEFHELKAKLLRGD